MNTVKSFPPVIKWSGSKRLVASQLAQNMPLKYKRYFEPFVGGGAMLPFSNGHEGYAGDIIVELIDLWKNIQVNPLRVASEYEERWKRLQIEGIDVYYEIRDRFNETRDCFDFLFLTRTCVNGLIRYNAQGKFNNSFHLSRPGIDPNRLRTQLVRWSKSIQKITFKNTDYREVLSDAEEGDFVFLDPPYGGTKDRYMRTDFNLQDFYAELERLNSRGILWMLTFDGTAGERQYSYAPPSILYKTKFLISTGNSSFTKVMDKKKDNIRESVYLNFKPQNPIRDLFY